MFTVPVIPANGPKTLADLVRGSKMVRDALLVIGFSLFMALCAQISIPLAFTPVPITGQTLGLLLAGAILGPKRGAAAMTLYLAQGVVGLPVFAGGTFGFAKIIGPTGGYLLSYPIVAALVGWLASRGWDRKVPTALAAMLIGNVVVYLIGVPWLNIYKGTLFQVDVVWAGIAPFILGDAIKVVLAALALPSAWALFGRSSEPDTY